jgi:hypothetical protein
MTELTNCNNSYGYEKEYTEADQAGVCIDKCEAPSYFYRNEVLSAAYCICPEGEEFDAAGDCVE